MSLSFFDNIYQLIFHVWSFFSLYWLGAIYVLKELNRKWQLCGTVRKLSPDDPDIEKNITGEVAVITGGSRGIGLEAAKILLDKGCHVIIASSANSKVAKQIEISLSKQISQESKAKVEIWHLDLTSLESVVKFAERLRDSSISIQYLINNAAIMFAPQKITENGFESHFQVNYLGHCLLIWLLIPLLVASSRKNEKRARIINVSSSTHFARDLRLGDLQSRIYSPFHAYAQSKLAQIMFTFKLSRWLSKHNDFGDHITVNTLHPGVAKTELYEHVWWVKLFPWLAQLFFRVCI